MATNLAPYGPRVDRSTTTPERKDYCSDTIAASLRQLRQDRPLSMSSQGGTTDNSTLVHLPDATRLSAHILAL